MKLESVLIKCVLVLSLLLPALPGRAQRVLTLDECRALALDGNKQLQVSRVKQSIAENLRKSARTKYLPRVSAIGAYEFTSREISILNKDQKAMLNGLGEIFGNAIASEVSKLPLDPAQIQELSQMAAPWVSRSPRPCAPTRAMRLPGRFK